MNGAIPTARDPESARIHLTLSGPGWDPVMVPLRKYEIIGKKPYWNAVGPKIGLGRSSQGRSQDISRYDHEPSGERHILGQFRLKCRSACVPWRFSQLHTTRRNWAGDVTLRHALGCWDGLLPSVFIFCIAVQLLDSSMRSRFVFLVISCMAFATDERLPAWYRGQ